jgi:hypothetical protein
MFVFTVMAGLVPATPITWHGRAQRRHRSGPRRPISVFNRNGKFLRTIGKTGTGPG